MLLLLLLCFCFPLLLETLPFDYALSEQAVLQAVSPPLSSSVLLNTTVEGVREELLGLATAEHYHKKVQVLRQELKQLSIATAAGKYDYVVFVLGLLSDCHQKGLKQHLLDICQAHLSYSLLNGPAKKERGEISRAEVEFLAYILKLLKDAGKEGEFLPIIQRDPLISAHISKFTMNGVQTWLDSYPHSSHDSYSDSQLTELIRRSECEQDEGCDDGCQQIVHSMRSMLSKCAIMGSFCG